MLLRHVRCHYRPFTSPLLSGSIDLPDGPKRPLESLTHTQPEAAAAIVSAKTSVRTRRTTDADAADDASLVK